MLKLVVLALIPLVFGQFILFDSYGADDTCGSDIVFQFASLEGVCLPVGPGAFIRISINGTTAIYDSCQDANCTMCAAPFTGELDTCVFVTPQNTWGQIHAQSSFPASGIPNGVQFTYYADLFTCDPTSALFATYYGSCYDSTQVDECNNNFGFMSATTCNDPTCSDCPGTPGTYPLNLCISGQRITCDYIPPTPPPTPTGTPIPAPDEYAVASIYADDQCTIPVGQDSAIAIDRCINLIPGVSIRVSPESAGSSTYLQYQCNTDCSTCMPIPGNGTRPGCSFEPALGVYVDGSTSPTFPNSPFTTTISQISYSNVGCTGTPLLASFFNADCSLGIVYDCQADGVYAIRNCTTDPTCQSGCVDINPPVLTYPIGCGLGFFPKQEITCGAQTTTGAATTGAATTGAATTGAATTGATGAATTGAATTGAATTGAASTGAATTGKATTTGAASLMISFACLVLAAFVFLL